MRFKVRLFDNAALAVHELVVDASSRVQVERAYSGQTVLAIRKVWTRPFATRREKLDVAWWCRELRTLLAAGMTIVEAVETLGAQDLGAARARVHEELSHSLAQGLPLSAAMERIDAFPPVLIAGVRASERTSGLIEALDDYVRYHELLDGLRRKVISAAIYPSLVIGLGALITCFLLLFVIPRFSKMYGDVKGSVSWSTQALVQLSQAMNSHGAYVFAGLGVAAAGIALWIKSGLATRHLSELVLRIEPLERRINEFRLAKLYHSLALMFRGGYTLDEALMRCQTLRLGRRMSRDLEIAAAALRNGRRVSGAFANLTDAVTGRLLLVGERTGNFETVLQSIADRHAANFTTFVERVTKVVEPLLLLFVALVVGGIVVLMYMPVFDIASSLR